MCFSNGFKNKNLARIKRQWGQKARNVCNEENGLNVSKVGKLSGNDDKDGFKVSERNVQVCGWINGSTEKWFSHAEE